MRLIVLTVLFLALGSSPALSASRSDALIILNNLMEEGAATRHPESFKVLIETYFSGVKCLEEKKPELAAKYFALVEKYGKILAPYFLTLQPGQQLITPSRHKREPVPAQPAFPSPGPAAPQAARESGADLAAAAALRQALEPVPNAAPDAPKAAAAPAPRLAAAPKLPTPAAALTPPVVPAPIVPAPAAAPLARVTPPAAPVVPAAATGGQTAHAVQPGQPESRPHEGAAPKTSPEPAAGSTAPLRSLAVAPSLPPARPLAAHPAPQAAAQQAAQPEASWPGNAASQEEDEDGVVDDVAAEGTGEDASRPAPQVAGSIMGGETLYRVRANDTLLKIAARFKIRPHLLARLNRLTTSSLLREGQTLRIVNRRIVPYPLDEGLIINIADCTLYCFKDGKLSRTVPIAAGRAELKQNRSWQTPLGSFKVVDKVKNPSWRVPVSIQKEMEQQGQEVKTLIPPGPANPLGKYALRTSLPGILIHGTNRPSSISSYSSHGCIRVSPANIELLYNEVPVNTAGKIVYRPVKVAVSAGKTYLEVHKDIYGKIEDLEKEARNLIEEAGGGAPIDWRKVRRMVKEQTGVAEEVTRTR
ncbi:hypothetical protein GMST_04590 [Geomonas silvestris]|uniref:Uncharacterized protein n=1 Tax=Geomonas silvestris TaxID=2740184 RepID=A0A6V8ME40_9BACT|nr:L,D-transpeptidase family protein [Geomonas silvestris]GFO58134.1 hypothetical protein GMST_04590 [Geomonas silvestris]